MYSELDAKHKIWLNYKSGRNKVYQQQLISWWWWCTVQYIPRNTNETPVQSGSIWSDSAFDDNLIDGHGLSWLIHLQPSSIEFPFQSVSLVKMLIRKKRTRVQVAPAANVCTGYDTVRHFGSPINKMASFQIMLVYYIPLWPQAAGKWLWAFDSTLVNLLQSFLLAVLRCLLWRGSLVGRGRAMIRVDSLNLWLPSVHHNTPSVRGLAVERLDILTSCSPFEFSQFSFSSEEQSSGCVQHANTFRASGSCAFRSLHVQSTHKATLIKWSIGWQLSVLLKE